MIKIENKCILDLCGGSGSWSRPYKAAGYDVRLITLPEYDVRYYSPPKNVYGVLAAPPCTEFTPLKTEQLRDIDKGLEIVYACINIINKCKPQFWAVENPTGKLGEYLGKPRLTFQPWQYGDPWSKRTDIWGEFNVPNPLYSTWEQVPNKLPLYTRPGRKIPGFNYLHKRSINEIPQLQFASPKTDGDFRSITPPGFANAFFEANR